MNQLTSSFVSVQLLVEFADVRILAFGILNKRTSFTVNKNARQLLHPPGVEKNTEEEAVPTNDNASDSSQGTFASNAQDHIMTAQIPAESAHHCEPLVTISMCSATPLTIEIQIT